MRCRVVTDVMGERSLLGQSRPPKGNLTSMSNRTLTYDVENRMVQAVHTSNGTERYVYDPANQRVWKQEPSRTLVYFYGIEGNLLATYGDGVNTDYNVYFGAKLVWAEASPGIAAGPVTLDRLGSTVKHLPYGNESTGTGEDRVKFATYYRDQTSTLDYARNRYYSRSIARFTSPDPYRASGGPADPQSWNRYSYVQGDPVNANDPSGLAMIFGCYDDRCWGGGGLFWDSFGGDYDSFDFVDEFNLNQYGYMQEHMSPDALAGLEEYDAYVAANSPSPADLTNKPATLVAEPDCYTRDPFALFRVVYMRQVTYTLFGTNNRPFPTGSRAVVTESLRRIRGPRPPESSSEPGEPFPDQTSVRGGRDFVVDQTFSARVGGETYPLVIVNRLGEQSDANRIEAYPGYVSINRDRNLGPNGKPRLCP
jgi:RHS repeat-associated protein